MIFKNLSGPQHAKHPARMVSLLEMPAQIYAIGDVHGCLDQLRALDAQIVEHAAAMARPSVLVMLGDVIDRGPSSAQVIDHLMKALPGITRICLRGNHEQMMLRFIDNPKRNKSWLRFGGQETLASYGVFLDRPSDLGPGLRVQLEAAIPEAHLEFLSQMLMGLVTPAAIFAHAAYDPGAEPAAQSSENLLWKDPTRVAYDELGRLYVHGHVPVAEAQQIGNRINLDTHCYRSGKLSAVCLRPDAPPEFLST